MFKNMGGNIPGGNFLGGSFPDTVILDKSVSAIFKNIFGFNFICVLVYFKKCVMTSVHKNPRIYVINIHYFANRRHTFLHY